MNALQKKKVKDFFKKHIATILSSIIFALLGVGFFLLGLGLQGWSLIDWIQSQYAITFFILIVIGFVSLIRFIAVFKK